MKLIQKNKNSKSKNDKIATLFKTEYRNMLQYACYRLGCCDDAEDSIQDIFLRMSDKVYGTYEQKPEHLRNYAFRSLANECTDRLRRRQADKFVTLEKVAAVTEESETVFEKEHRNITSLLADIPEEQAEVIRLRLYGNKSFADIAEIMDIPPTTAKSRFQYGIEKIRKAIEIKH